LPRRSLNYQRLGAIFLAVEKLPAVNYPMSWAPFSGVSFHRSRDAFLLCFQLQNTKLEGCSDGSTSENISLGPFSRFRLHPTAVIAYPEWHRR
jgi:hypothetical protein